MLPSASVGATDTQVTLHACKQCLKLGQSVQVRHDSVELFLAETFGNATAGTRRGAGEGALMEPRSQLFAALPK